MLHVISHDIINLKQIFVRQTKQGKGKRKDTADKEPLCKENTAVVAKTQMVEKWMPSESSSCSGMTGGCTDMYTCIPQHDFLKFSHSQSPCI